MTDKRQNYVALLLLAVFAFVLYIRSLAAVLVLQVSQTSLCFFMSGRPFLMEFLDSPGGFLLYAGRFFSQFYRWTWLGALIIAVFVTGFAVIFHLVLSRLRGSASILLTFIPCVFLLAPDGPMACTVNDVIALMAVYGAFLGYLALRTKRIPRCAYAVILTPVLYLIVGGFFWLFVIAVTATEWFDSPLRSHLAFKFLFPVLAACAPLAAYRWLFAVPLKFAFVHPTAFDVRSLWPAFALLGYVAVMPILVQIPWSQRLTEFWTPSSTRSVQAVVLLFFSIVIPLTYHSADMDSFAKFHRLYEKKEWDSILADSKNTPSPSLAIQFFTNYSLYKKGMLLDKMFSYPQMWGSRGLFQDLMRSGGREWDPQAAAYNSELFFEMGHINASFRSSYNRLVAMGRTRRTLRRIAECHIVNRNYTMAEKYVNILDKTLFEGEFVKRCRAMLRDTSIADREYAELRALAPTVELDMFSGEFVPLLTLLKSVPGNRMAFDYLMAWCLLDKSALPLASESVSFFGDSGYTVLPAHCQEAFLMLEVASRSPVETPGLERDEAVTANFTAFATQVLARHESLEEAEQLLGATFRDTYMYYYVFGRAPQGLDYSPTHERVASMFYARGQLEDAAAHYGHALRLKPQSAAAHIGMGNVLTSQKKLKEAEPYYEKALQLAPDSSEARSRLDRLNRLTTE